METFIVLGLCFIIYEALDLFHSCYSNQQQHSFGGSEFNGGNNFDDDSGGGNGSNSKNSNADAISVNKDTAKLLRLDSIDEIESIEDNNESSSFPKVFSICESVVHNNYQINNFINNNDNNKNIDDIERLITS